MRTASQPRRTGRTPSVRTAVALCMLAVGLLGAGRAEAGSSLSVKITSAPPSTTTSTDATIAFTASSGAKTSCKLDEGSAVACSSPVTYSGVPVGNHKFVVTATYSKKTASATASWQVAALDSGSGSSSPAGFSVTSSIANGATVSGSLPWEAKTSRIAKVVTYYIDGALKWTEQYSPYIFNGDGNKLNTTTLANGSHFFKIAATASDGTKAETSATVQVSNGTTPPPPPPFTTTSSIANGATLAGSVAWTATPSKAVSAVAFSIDGALKWTDYYSPYVFNGDGNTLNTTTLVNGSHTLKIVATAIDGSQSTVTLTVTVSNTLTPFTTTSSIANGATLTGSVVWTATPSRAASKVDFYVDGSLGYTDAATPYSFNGDAGTLDTTKLTNAGHTLKVVATAIDGSQASATMTVQVSNSAPPTPPPAGSNSAGRPLFTAMTSSSTDSWTNNPTSDQQLWFRNHWDRAVVYSSYWDSKNSWYPGGWVYQDSYAIYNPSTLATQHPEWILKDSAGNKLYIPWGCSGGTCPQYAADIGNPAWVQHFIDGAKALMAKGYKGLFIDDVNMDMNVGNGQGQQVAPIDPRTGAAMSDTTWKSYFASFMEQVRAALPGVEIVHNAVWFAGGGQHDATNPYIVREIKAANYVDVERGCNDSGLTGGTGSWSVFALMRYIDNVHSAGARIVMQSYASDATGAEYNLAGYLLVNDGQDFVSTSFGTLPSSAWSAYDVDLGAATGGRYLWNGVWRRNFTGGIVLMSEPGSATKTLDLGATFVTTGGTSVTSVTLSASRGAVLKKA